MIISYTFKFDSKLLFWISKIVQVSIFILIFGFFLTSLIFHPPQSNTTQSFYLRSPQKRYLPAFIDHDYTETLPLEGKFIFLDPGHGGHDPGCVYPQTQPEYLEKDFNLTIAMEVAPLLESMGATVILTRENDVWLSIYARVAMLHLYFFEYADAQGLNTLPNEISSYLQSGMRDTIRVNSENISDGCMGPMVGSGFSDEMIMLLELQYDVNNFLFLSIHNNWNHDSSIRGTQVYYVTDESIIESEKRLLREDPYYYSNPDYIVRDPYYGRDGEQNAMLAQIMYDSIIEAAPEMETNTRTTVEDNFAVLREHGMPSVMLELGFLSNKLDRQYLSDPKIIRNLADGIANGCVHFFEYVDSDAIVEH